MLLQANNLDVTISGLNILQNVSFNIDQGELVVIVGANGAGKTTLLRTLSGLTKCQNGSVNFDGADITNKAAYELASKGICLAPQGRGLFPGMTARDNLLVGAYPYRKDKKRVLASLQNVYETFPVLERNKERIASTFSGGEQQMITIGRGLMSNPKLLMIDELSLGLAPIIISSLFDIIKKLNEKGMSILLIEQNARQALRIADRAYVMEGGTITISGSGEELLNNETVKTAYLGL